MFRNYLITAWRNLRKNRLFSFINIAGLALGIACSLLIILHIKEELNYDQGFPGSKRIFRVTMHEKVGQQKHWAAISPLIGDEIKNTIPEVDKSVRFYRPYPYNLFSARDASGVAKRFEERKGFYADSTVISVFDLKFAVGDARTALTEPDAIVMSESMARKYFGDESPLGKTIQDENGRFPMKVTGVIHDFEFNTHLQFDYLMSMPTVRHSLDTRSMENRYWSAFYTYVVLKPETTVEQIQNKLQNFTYAFYKGDGGSRQEILAGRNFELQPIEDIHLRSKLEKEMYANSDIRYVYIFSIAAIFILLVAAVNFVNTSTALAIKRMKEIGMRKVIGATKAQLIRQFLGEAFLTTILATLIAGLLLNFAMPFYTGLTGREFHLEQFLSPQNAVVAASLVVLISVASGIYPAWFVSKFNVISSIKGSRLNHVSVHGLRKGLIVFQFVVSVFMIFCTIIVYRQMQLFHNKHLGFDKEQVIAVTMYQDMWQHFGPLMNELDKNRNILDRSTTSTLPGERFSFQEMLPLGSQQEQEFPNVRVMWTDHRFLKNLHIGLVTGRNFLPQFPQVQHKEFILNEAAVKAYNLKDPVGKKMIVDIDTGEVVGVVKDFNFASLHAFIEPMVIQYNPYRSNYLLIKAAAGTTPELLEDVKKTITSLMPGAAFTYNMLDEKLDRLYDSENKMSQVFKVFAGFTILISCLGLFGLSAFAAQLRTKEIGIRKVLGASSWRLSLMLSFDFVILVLIAIIIALPLAGWTMNYWLQSFAYKTGLNAWIFIVSGLTALFLAFSTVGLQAVKAAVQNPVKSLKND